MAGDHADYRRPQQNEFDRWELAELIRRNCGRSGDDLTLRLPGIAYEARRLWRYVE
jgi:hypothetical protein